MCPAFYQAKILRQGLGKTVQSIACMLQNRPDEEKDSPKTTLILAPLALLEQWAQEIEDKTEAETFSVLIYVSSSCIRRSRR